MARADLTVSFRVDPQIDRLARRIRDLEFTLDDALAALDSSATLRQREDARQSIRNALVRRRTLRGSRPSSERAA